MRPCFGPQADSHFVSSKLSNEERPMKTASSATRGISVMSSPHSLPTQVVCVERGAIRWRGAIDRLAAAQPFDAVYCHDDDAETVRRAVASLTSPHSG